MSQYDVIVIGGAPSGLCSAALLAKAGKKVLVLEKEAALGGRAFTTTYKGHAFDNTAHYPSRQGHLEAVFKEIGKPYPEFFSAWGGLLKWKDGGWSPVMDDFEHKYLSKMIKEIIGSSYEDLAKLFPVRLKDWVAARYDNEGMHHFWWSFAQSIYGGTRYEDFSAGDVLVFLKEHFDAIGEFGGCWSLIKGGLRNLLRPLHDSILENGGEIRTGTPVTMVVIEDGKAVGVQIEKGPKIVPNHFPDTETITASTVICTLPTWDILRVVPKSQLPHWYAERVEFIARQFGPLIGVTFGMPKEANNWDPTWGTWLRDDQTKSKLSVWGSYVPGYVPEGEHQLFYWFMGHYWELPNAVEMHLADNKLKLQQVMSVVNEDLKTFYPDVVENCLWRTDHYAAWGLASYPGLRGELALDFEVPDVNGLYLVSDMSRGASGVGWQAAARSARVCVGRILDPDMDPSRAR